MRNLDLISRSILETKAIISLNRLQFSIAYQQQLLTVQYNRCSSQRSMLTQVQKGQERFFYLGLPCSYHCTWLVYFYGEKRRQLEPSSTTPLLPQYFPPSEALDVPDETENSVEQEFLVLQSLFLDQIAHLLLQEPMEDSLMKAAPAARAGRTLRGLFLSPLLS